MAVSSQQVVSTPFLSKYDLIICPPLGGVESWPFVLMFYILAFSDQFVAQLGQDFASVSS